ncbi:tetratricopeptide repeat protein [Hymenobacter nivis]|uniref:tetratricopeptide repeat protein n=1 Tax=Hymenobacter nivis TaxID=1850093 RepID=UPI00112C07D2|nr:hypothetical protein [Hymenobacter nivis]
MTTIRVLTTAGLALALLAGSPRLARAQKVRQPTDGGQPGAAAAPRPARLQPLFGGLTPAQATAAYGAPKLEAVAKSFASKEEASAFFATKGFEYLSENQPDTATSRFNLAWLLNPRNADPYRGLGVVASSQPTPDASIALLQQALAIAPTNTLVLSDLGTSHLIRYGTGKKKKDLTTGMDLLQRAVAADATNANAWQQLARGYYYQEKYPQAWEAVHKGQALSTASLDFGLVSDLLAKLPDPLGTFK